MTTRRSITFLGILLPVLVLAQISFLHGQTVPDSLLPRYVDALLREDWLAAEQCWLPSEVARSRQLGVFFEGIAAKYDCASPLFDALAGVRAGAIQVEFTAPVGAGDTLRASLILRAGTESLNTTYYIVPVSGGWRLCSPIAPRTRGWLRRETRFARVIYSDSTLLNDYALSDLDRFIDATARALGCTDDDLARLSQGKIDYYLSGEEDIQVLTGYSVHGMTSLPLDAVVTRHLPHYHELVHVLVNFALSPIPLHTVPILQEGLAVRLGGRWEKAPGVLMQLGAFMIEEGFGSVEDVLTHSAFHSPSADLDANYAVSGLLVDVLCEEQCLRGVLTAYNRLSGTSAQVQSWDMAHVQSELSEVCKRPWSSIEQSLREHAVKSRLGGILPGGGVPNSKPAVQITDDSVTVSIWDLGTDYLIDAAAKSQGFEVVLLLTERNVQGSGSYESRLFHKQMPNRGYTGERYGIAFTASEAGLYDYYTDNLIEKYVTGIHPGEGYWDAETQTVRFRLVIHALEAPLAGYVTRLAIP